MQVTHNLIKSSENNKPSLMSKTKLSWSLSCMLIRKSLFACLGHEKHNSEVFFCNGNTNLDAKDEFVKSRKNNNG